MSRDKPLPTTKLRGQPNTESPSSDHPSIEVVLTLAADTLDTGEIPDAARKHVASCDHCQSLAQLAAPLSHPAGRVVLEDLPVVSPDHYVAREELASRGGMGRIYRAFDRRLGRTVVIKEPLDDAAAGQIWLRSRFESEARLTARLHHPSIVSVYEAGRWPNGVPFYAMPWVRGRPLAQEIASRGSVGERLALLPHLLAAANAVSYAHDQGIVHRDIKPDNILVASFGETVLIDWGLAKCLADTRSHETDRAPYRSDLPSLTQFGVGTPQYMPPEQARGDEPDPRVDVYALGATLYHVLAGQPPYGDASDSQVRPRLEAGPPRPLASLASEAPADLIDLCEKAMARAPEDRFPQALGFADELRRFQSGHLLASRHYGIGERVVKFGRRHRAAVWVASVALAALAVIGGLGIRGIMLERDAATRERARAERQRRGAEAAASRLRLLHAREALDRDPTEAVAWLKTLSPTSPEWAEVRPLATAALRRGVATSVLPLGDHHDLNSLLSPDGSYVALWSPGLPIRLWPVGERGTRTLGRAIDSPVTKTAHPVAFSPDSLVLASVAGDRTVRLWNIDSLTVRSVFQLEDEAEWVAFRPDGKQLAVGGNDGGVSTLELPGGAVRHLGSQPHNALTASYSPDGKMLLISSFGEYQVWDLSTRSARTLSSSSDRLRYGAVWSPDGQVIAGLGNDDRVRLWRAATGSELASWPISDPRYARFSPDGRFIAASSGRGQLVRLWEVKTGASRNLTGPRSSFNTLRFSPDGRVLAAGSEDGKVALWSLDGPEKTTLSGAGRAWTAVDFAPDGTLLTRGSGGLRTWDLSRLVHHVVERHPDRAVSVAFSPDGAMLGSTALDQSARLVSLDGTNERALAIKRPEPLIPRAPGDAQNLERLAFAPDRRRIAVAGDGGVQVVDLVSGQTHELSAVESRITSVAWSGDARFVVTGADSGLVEIWDPTHGKLLANRRHQGRAMLAMASAASRMLSAGTDSPEVVEWNLLTLETRTLPAGEQPSATLAISPDGARAVVTDGAHVRVHQLDRGTYREFDAGSGDVLALAISPQGDHLAAAGWDPVIRLWDLRTGVTHSLRCFDDFVKALAFSPDGTRLVASGGQSFVGLFDLTSDRCDRLEGHSGPIYGVAFSPDGTMVASAGWDGTVRVWTDDLPFEPTDLRQELDRLTNLTVADDGTLGNAPPAARALIRGQRMRGQSNDENAPRK